MVLPLSNIHQLSYPLICLLLHIGNCFILQFRVIIIFRLLSPLLEIRIQFLNL